MSSKKKKNSAPDPLFFDEEEMRHDHEKRTNHGYGRPKEVNLMPGLIAMGVLAAVVVLVCLGLIGNIQHAGKVTGRTAALAVTETPATAVPDPTETPEPTAEPTPTPEPTEEPTQEQVATAGGLGLVSYNEDGTAVVSQYDASAYLPIVTRVDTTEKVIAITVDDLYQVNNLKTIIQLAVDAGGKLTLFPIGSNLFKDGMKETLQEAVFIKGFEIGNHTYNHDRIFTMEDTDMCRSVWKQMAAVNFVLGVNYDEHFFRFMGGNGEECQRANVYLKQLGYDAIAHWSYSGSDATLEQSEEHLAPGMIYLFHTTDRDTAILQEFIPYVVSQGYKLVTLSELYGLEPNTWTELNTFDTTMPTLDAFVWDLKDIGKGDYSWRTLQMQIRLNELGYLPDTAKKDDGTFSGYFGDATVDAVMAFQKDHKLKTTGIADAATQKAILDKQEAEDDGQTESQ